MEQVLALVLQQTGADKIVGQFAALAKSSDTAAVATARDTKARLDSVAAIDLQAKAVAKAALVSATNAGGGGAGSAERLALSDATKVASQSTADAAVATRTLTVEQKAASLASGEMKAGAGGLSGVLQGLVGSSGGVAAALSTAFTAAAPLVALAIMFKLVSSGITEFVSLTSSVLTFQRIMGGTAQSASLVVGQMKGLGVDSDTASKAFLKFGQSVGTGADSLSAYGIAIARNKQGNVDLVATFDNLRRAYQGSADQANKDAIAKQLSARGAATLLPLLNATDAQINQLNAATKNRGEIFSQQDLTDGKNVKIAMTELGLAFKAMEVELAKGLAPALTGIAQKLTDLMELARKFKPSTLQDWTGATKDSTAALAANKVTLAEHDAALAADIKDTDALVSSTESLLGAQRSQATAQKDLTKAVEAYAVASDVQRALVAAGVEGFDAHISAMDGMVTAEKAATKAGEDLASAQADLVKAQEPATALELADANNKLAQSFDNIALAADDVNDKQTKLNELLAGGSGATVNEIQRARDELQAAKDKQVGAGINYAQAGDAKAVVAAQGSPSDPAVIAAQAKVVAAHQGVADALDSEVKAYGAVLKSNADYAKAIKDGQAALDTSLDDIKGKVEGVETANLNLAKAQDAFSTALTGPSAQAVAAAVAYLKPFPSYYDAITKAASGAALAITNPDNVAANPGATPPPVPAYKLPSYANPGQLSGARAAGGPVEAGGTYLVGERGPELLRMGSQSGGVTANGAGAVNLTVNAQTGASAQDIAREVSWNLNTLQAPRTRAA